MGGDVGWRGVMGRGVGGDGEEVVDGVCVHG